MNKHQECLVCKGKELKPIQDYSEKKGLIKCGSCDFVFMENIPTSEELNSFYSAYSYSAEGRLSPITVKSYNAILDEFEKYRKTNKILDVGCGRGWFLLEAKKRNWEVYGTEYSETAVQLCEKNGIRMKAGQISADTFKNEEFDVITSFEVLEHINNPIQELTHIHKFLRKGGLFYCTTPNFNSAMRYYLKTDYNVIVYPEHLSYYSKKTLNKVVEERGFKNLKFLSTGISISRIQASKPAPQSEKPVSKVSSDEQLRKRIDKKWYLGIAKNLVNFLLTRFNLGLTLKGYYIKK